MISLIAEDHFQACDSGSVVFSAISGKPVDTRPTDAASTRAEAYIKFDGTQSHAEVSNGDHIQKSLLSCRGVAQILAPLLLIVHRSVSSDRCSMAPESGTASLTTSNASQLQQVRRNFRLFVWPLISHLVYQRFP